MHLRSASSLAMCYKDSVGTLRNMEKCKEWLERAYGLDKPLSTINYAYFCCKDNPDMKKRILMRYEDRVEKMAISRDVLAQFEYADYLLGYSDNKRYGFEIMELVASLGFAPAQNRFGVCFFDGTVISQNYGKAVEWFRKAAEQGYAWGQCNLADMYRDGKGVAQNYTEAVKWYTKAAEQGIGKAQNSLGNRYFNGEGITKDISKAIEWYKKALENGSEYAKGNLQACGVYV